MSKDLKKYIRETIKEAFDSNLEINWEQKNTLGWEGYFNTPKNKRFRIEILPYTDGFLNKHKSSAYAFKFSRWNDAGNHWDMDLTNFKEEQFVIFGTLTKAVTEFMDISKPKFLFFIGDVDDRKPVYKALGYRLTQKYSTEYGFNDYQLGNDYIVVLSAKNIEKEVYEYVGSHIDKFRIPQL